VAQVTGFSLGVAFGWGDFLLTEGVAPPALRPFPVLRQFNRPFKLNPHFFPNTNR